MKFKQNETDNTEHEVSIFLPHREDFLHQSSGIQVEKMTYRTAPCPKGRVMFVLVHNSFLNYAANKVQACWAQNGKVGKMRPYFAWPYDMPSPHLDWSHPVDTSYNPVVCEPEWVHPLHSQGELIDASISFIVYQHVTSQGLQTELAIKITEIPPSNYKVSE